MVAAKRLGHVIGSVWFRISSSHNNSGPEGGICNIVRIEPWNRARKGGVLLFWAAKIIDVPLNP